MGYKQGTMSDDEMIRLMVEEPNLIKRPLITLGGEVVVGFDKAAKARLAGLLGQELS
jgi:arsenate reductase-like glutaredoxin family protein